MTRNKTQNRKVGIYDKKKYTKYLFRKNLIVKLHSAGRCSFNNKQFLSIIRTGVGNDIRF